MKQILFVISIFTSLLVFGQNPKGFDKMVSSYVKGSVNLVNPEDLENQKVIFLDAREKEEYNISHIEDAVYIGYDDFNISGVDTLDKQAKIVVYCSIGYRSEKIGEKLLRQGFKDVNNLYGGIFNWANTGHQIYRSGQTTTNVHGYSKSWSKWLNEDKVTVVTGKKK